MTLKPIALETQLEDLLLGQNPKDYESFKMKLDFTKKYIGSIIAVNGKKVYHPVIDGEDIYYYLSPAPKWFAVTEETKRKYYYPVKYAEIQFFDNKP
jgi:hypothetical protein